MNFRLFFLSFAACLLLGACSGNSSGGDSTGTQTNPTTGSGFTEIKNEINGKPLSGQADPAYTSLRQRKEYPWVLHLAVRIESPDTNGQPKPDALAGIETLERNFRSELDAQTENVYIGRMAYNGNLDFLFCLADPAPVKGWLAERENQSVQPVVFPILKEDTAWIEVQHFFEGPAAGLD